MTDRVHSLTVVLSEDIREDEIDGLIEGIKHFRGVSTVGTNVTNASDYVARCRMYDVVRDKMLAVIKEIRP